MKKTMIILAAAAVLAGCAAGKEPGEPVPVKTAEAVRADTLPSCSWQTDVRFPDWQGRRNGNYASNDRLSFYCFSRQGELYVQSEDGCTDFTLYVNDRQVNTDAAKDGTLCRVDLSEVTQNGRNTLQVSDIAEGSVHICIPYPAVIPGTPQETGLSADALDLIDTIISCDIERGFPAAQLAVVKDGKLVYENAWGNVQTYDREGNCVQSAPVTSETLFDLASNTKMYSVNYAVQYLYSLGKLDPDTRITDILGDAFAEDTIRIDYEGYEPVSRETAVERKRKLTVRHLLTHQGGFPPGPHYYNDRYDHATQDYDSDAGNVLYSGTGADAETREKTKQMIFATPVMYEPGTAVMYSDLDYMILGLCVEGLTGKRLDAYLREVFWEPMGLTHITYNPLENGFAKEDCAATELMGNSRDGQLHYSGIRTDVIQGEVHDPNAYYCMDGVSGHAGLFASASDLARLASVMLSGGYGPNRWFSQDAIDLFTAPNSSDVLHYGLGWWREGDHVRDRYFGSVTSSDTFGHQGFTGTLTMIDPEENLVVVLLTNSIHTRLLENDATLSKYKGGFYTTSVLGFVPQILSVSAESDSGLLRSILNDMIRDAERQLQDEGISEGFHPKYQAYLSLQDALKKWDDRTAEGKTENGGVQ